GRDRGRGVAAPAPRRRPGCDRARRGRAVAAAREREPARHGLGRLQPLHRALRARRRVAALRGARGHEDGLRRDGGRDGLLRHDRAHAQLAPRRRPPRAARRARRAARSPRSGGRAMSRLTPLPPQPEGVPWPTREWLEGAPDPDVDAVTLENVAARAFRTPPPESHGETLALLVVHRSRLVLERYAPGKGPADTFPSWSMAKSILHAATGPLVAAGKLALHAPAPVPAWRTPGAPRGAIPLAPP